VGRIMLEFTLLAWDSENYNIINWALPGDIDRVLRACGTHFRGRGLEFPGLLRGSRCWS
jgi:hypothetical protein